MSSPRACWSRPGSARAGCVASRRSGARGCDTVHGTGYKGRVGLFEVMEITETLRERIIVSGASAIELRKAAMAEGMV